MFFRARLDFYDCFLFALRGRTTALFTCLVWHGAERLNEHRSLRIGRGGVWQNYRIEASGRSGGALTVKLAGVENRDQAQALRGAQVCVPRSELPQRDDRDFYRADLIGCEVVNLDGISLGSVQHFIESPGQGLMVRRGTREFWIPAGPEHLRRRGAVGTVAEGRGSVDLGADGRRFEQGMAREARDWPGLVLVAGRYEGVDERFIERETDEQWSIGDYVLSGGELPALVVIDAIARLIPGTLGRAESAVQESFSDGLVGWPHYTPPPGIDGQAGSSGVVSGGHPGAPPRAG